MPDDDFDDATERTVVFDRRDLVPQEPAKGSKSHVFVRMDGSDVGQVTTLTGTEISLGRIAKSEIHLPFEGVSRSHARLLWEDGAYVIEDLASANGTFVQGNRIQRQRLADGDVVQLGPRVVFRYSVTDTGEERILRQLYESSVKDSLTGAYNREYLGERLKAEVAYAKRHGTSLSVLMLDVDHFKKVNDTYGHQAGDAVLVATVGAISRTLRSEDVVARYGGEEFAVVCPATSLEAAAHLADRIRQAFPEQVRVPNSTQMCVTASIGVSATDDPRVASVQDLINQADHALVTVDA